MGKPHSYTAMLRHLESAWPEQPHKVRAIAARYYIGAESLPELRQRATIRPVTSDFDMLPELSEQQVEAIIELR